MFDMYTCFCVGPGINSRSAVLAPRLVGPRANTADRESIPGPIQKQPVRNTFIKFVIIGQIFTYYLINLSIGKF